MGGADQLTEALYLSLPTVSHCVFLWLANKSWFSTTGCGTENRPCAVPCGLGASSQVSEPLVSAAARPLPASQSSWGLVEYHCTSARMRGGAHPGSPPHWTLTRLRFSGTSLKATWQSRSPKPIHWEQTTPGAGTCPFPHGVSTLRRTSEAWLTPSLVEVRQEWTVPGASTGPRPRPQPPPLWPTLVAAQSSNDTGKAAIWLLLGLTHCGSPVPFSGLGQ